MNQKGMKKKTLKGEKITKFAMPDWHYYHHHSTYTATVTTQLNIQRKEIRK